MTSRPDRPRSRFRCLRPALVAAMLALAMALPASASKLGNFFPNARAFGQFGTEAGEFRTPAGIALSPDGFLYVADYKNNTVLKFDEDGRFVGPVVPGEVPFDAPVALAFDSRKQLYVVEEKGCRVRLYDAKGSLRAVYGGPGPESGKFKTPRGIAIGVDDHVFVADSENLRIQEFDANFAWIRNFRFRDVGRRPAQPRGLAVDREGKLWACFSNVHRVARFDAQGNADLVVGDEGTGLGQFLDPRSIAFDLQNNFYVTDYGNGRIQRFSPKGDFLFSVGTKGSGRTQFKGPMGISVDLKGNVYIADSDNFRVQVLLINDLLADLNLAAYHDGLKEYEKALPIYQKILNKVPLHQEAIQRVVAICEILAERERAANRLEQAKPYLQEILRLQPSNVQALQFKRWILWRNNKGTVYYLTLGTGIFFTFVFLVTTMVKILTSD